MSNLEARTTELLQRLIQFDTVNPPGSEQAAQEYLAGLLGEAGFDCTMVSSVEGRPNLVATLAAPSDGPVLALAGHVDTVLADPGEWSVDPWSGELKDGCVWGRGAVDMKSQVAAEIAAALVLREEGWSPAEGALKLIVTADEEAGAQHGAQFLCAQHPDLVRCDYAVNEGAGEVFPFGDRRIYGVCVAEKGVFRFTITTTGVAGHASIPRIGDNALPKLAPLLTAMAERQPSYVSTAEPEALFAALGEPLGDDIAGALERVRATDPLLAVLFEPLLGVTLTPTMANASQKINVIPSRAEVQVDCRVPAGFGREETLAGIREVLGEGGYEIEFHEEIVGNRSPIESPLMEHIREFVDAEDPGAHIAPTALPGFTDNHWFRKAFPDVVAYGFFPQNAMNLFEVSPLVHGADERIPVADLGLAARFYHGLVPKLLGDSA